MEIAEFSAEFDTLYNNITSNQAPGVDDYEKSVFLTRSQEEKIKNYFNPKSNKLQEGFDDNEKRQIDFSEITKTSDITNDNPGVGYQSLDSRAQLFLMPLDTFMVINERIILTEGQKTYGVTVVPISYRQYDLLMSKPYKEPLPRQCWRMIQANSDTPVNPQGQRAVSEIISKTGTTVSDYKIRYVKRPQPIILTDLTSSGLSINGISTVTECELNPIIHREILNRAVELAVASYKQGDLQSMVSLNQRDE